MSRGSERLADSDKVLRREGWRLLRDSLRPQWRLLIFSVFAALLWTCAKLAVPLLVAAAVDQGIVPGDAGETLKYTGLIVLVGVLQGAGMGMRRYGAFRMSYRVETDLRARLFAHLQLLHFAYHDEAQTGQLMAHANTDLYQISQWLSLGPISLSSLFILIGVIIVMVLVEPGARVARARRVAAAQRDGHPLLATAGARRPGAAGEARRPVGRRRGVGRRHPRGQGLRRRAARGRPPRHAKPTRCSNARSSPLACGPASCPRSTSCPRSRSRRSSGTAATRCSTATSRSATSSRSTSTS